MLFPSENSKLLPEDDKPWFSKIYANKSMAVNLSLAMQADLRNSFPACENIASMVIEGLATLMIYSQSGIKEKRDYASFEYQRLMRLTSNRR